MTTTGYKFMSVVDAEIALSQCNSYYGIPVSPTDVTQSWTNFFHANLNQPEFWYIYEHESLIPVLGQPTTFDVVLPPD